MSGSLPEEEVILYQKKLITIVLDEMSDYEHRRFGRKTLQEAFNTFWRVIATELMSGNRVISPIGTFTPHVVKKYDNINWTLAGVKKSIRPVSNERVQIKYQASKLLKQSIQNLLERTDEQEARIHRESADKRRLERAARRKQRATYARVGRNNNEADDANLR